MNATAHLIDTNEAEVHSATIAFGKPWPRCVTWSGKVYALRAIDNNVDADSDVYYREVASVAL